MNQSAESDAVSDLAFPEHIKLQKISDASQKCGEFLDWLREEKEICLAKIPQKGMQGYRDGLCWPENTSTEKLLAEFFEIDQMVLEAEKRAMLSHIREATP